MSSPSSSGVKKTVFILIAIISAVIGLTAAKVLGVFTPSPSFSKDELKNQGIYVFEKSREIKPFELMTHNQEAFNLSTLKGHWNLLFFGYTSCPDICPTTLSTLNKVHKNSKAEQHPDFKVYMVTVDPDRDTPNKLQTYVPFFNEAFGGVTGNIEVIGSLATQLNVVFAKAPIMDETDPSVYHMDHSGQIAIVDPNGLYHGFIRPPFNVDLIVDVMAFLSDS